MRGSAEKMRKSEVDDLILIPIERRKDEALHHIFRTWHGNGTSFLKISKHLIIGILTHACNGKKERKTKLTVSISKLGKFKYQSNTYSDYRWIKSWHSFLIGSGIITQPAGFHHPKINDDDPLVDQVYRILCIIGIIIIIISCSMNSDSL